MDHHVSYVVNMLLVVLPPLKDHKRYVEPVNGSREVLSLKVLWKIDVISTFHIHLLPQRLHYHCFFFSGLGIESCILLPGDLDLVDKKLTIEDKRG